MTNNPKTTSKRGSLLSVVGWIITLSAVLIGTSLIFIDVMWGQQNPYTGVVTYMVIPGFISMGIFFLVVSWILRIRYSHTHEYEVRGFILDFNNPKHRQRAQVFGIGLLLFMAISAVGTYRSYHFTESTQFCGMTCHKVMQPEYVTYHNSPHAKVDCVECHIGAGADWYVKSKMSGLYQVYAYTFGTYHLPIETPIRNLRPARETCEECHWPDKFSGNLEKTIYHTMRDEENTPYVIRLLLKVGGGKGEKATGIHWHISSGNKIEYIAEDRERVTIPWVRMTDREGNVKIFTNEDCDPDIASTTREIRTMDCIDCHNRPSHIFNDPNQMVNKALASGVIDAKLPGVKDIAMTLLEEAYGSTEEAVLAIETTFREKYLADEAMADATTTHQAETAIQTVKRIYTENFFPEMHVDWTTHPNFIGHWRWDGCYRCHDGNHRSEEGEVISHACNNCHLVIGQGEGWEAIQDMPYQIQDFVHPMELEIEPTDKCTDCHGAPAPTDYHKANEKKMMTAQGD